jgi:autophagy-related protein 9
MMTSNLLSRLLPTNPAGRSIYDDLRAHDEATESDIEEQAGLALDEENLGFRDDELGGADAFNGEDSRITTESAAFLTGQQAQQQREGSHQRRNPRGARSRWLAQSPRLLEEDPDDDVPASLLIEGDDMPGLNAPSQARTKSVVTQRKQNAIPGPSTRETRAHWEAAQAQQRLHQDEENVQGPPQPARQNIGLLAGSPKERAMWRWINVINLDNFMMDVYEYFVGAGMWCIVLERVLSLW